MRTSQLQHNSTTVVSGVRAEHTCCPRRISVANLKEPRGRRNGSAEGSGFTDIRRVPEGGRKRIGQNFFQYGRLQFPMNVMKMGE